MLCPTSLHSSRNEECMNFFWGSDTNKVCSRKATRGLGIRRLDHINNASPANLGWKILEKPNNWWVQIVKQKYLRHEDFLV